MSDRLGSAADQVEIGHCVLVEHLEGLDRTLGRYVHVALAIHRGGPHEIQRLRRDPASEALIDSVEDLRHRRYVTYRRPSARNVTIARWVSRESDEARGNTRAGAPTRPAAGTPPAG